MGHAHVVKHFHGTGVNGKRARRALRGRPLVDEATAYAAAQQFVGNNQTRRTAPDDEYCRVDHRFPSLAWLEPLPLTRLGGTQY
jgi:hypothetical protein